MKPAKIKIEGDFWDCQIYRGRLYLWTIEGSLKTIEWDNLVASLEDNKYKHLPLKCAFTQGNYLYNSNLRDVFQDFEFKNLLKEKFESITKDEIVIEKKKLHDSTYGEQENPFKELQVDSEILSNVLYALNDNELVSVNAHKYNRKKPVTTKLTNYFGIKAFSFKANIYAKMAISAGSDGLFEFDAFKARERHSRFIKESILRPISDKHSSFSDYTFESIYSSSLIGGSYFAYHKWHDGLKPDENPYNHSYERKFEKLFSEKEIFKNDSVSQLSWGNNEKIYRATERGIEVVRYNKYAHKNDELFTEAKLLSIHPWVGKIISAGTAYFGTIIECENALIVLLSTGEIFTIPGAVTRWRVYPRSINYENQLHVIFDDCIEIYSFNDDYFLDQSKKDLGIIYRPQSNSKFRRNSNNIRFQNEAVLQSASDIVKTYTNISKELQTDDLPF